MSCIRVEIPLTIIEGGTLNKTFQWKTGDPLLPVDLTGFTAHMQIRAKLKEEVVLLDVPSSIEVWAADEDTGIYFYDGVTIPDDEGKWRIYLRDNDTMGLCVLHKNIIGVYDNFLYSAAGEAVLQQFGVATILASVTRAEPEP